MLHTRNCLEIFELSSKQNLSSPCKTAGLKTRYFINYYLESVSKLLTGDGESRITTDNGVVLVLRIKETLSGQDTHSRIMSTTNAK
jgi:hypothetical protein